MPESIRDLAGAQSALAGRLDALEREVRRLPAGTDESDKARLDKLQEAVADLAAAHHEVHRQLDALTGAVEQLAAERLDDGDDGSAADHPRPAAFVPPVARRGWRPRLKGWARVVLRSTLGKLRHVWDASHPRPPWGDDLRLMLKDAPAKLPSLTVVGKAGIEARLERQTDGDVVRLIRDPDAENDDAAPSIDTAYVWDVGPGLADLPPTFVETARLLLATEELGFVCFQTPGDEADQWIVARELRHPDGGLDAGALCRRAKRHPGQVLGKIAGGDDELLPRALCRPEIRRRVRRSGRYVLAVATRPRTVEHRLAPVRAAARAARTDTGERPGVLLLLTADLAGGLERVVAAMLADLAEDLRPVLATTVPLSSLSAPRWRALERFTRHLYALGDVFAEALHAGVIQELLARHHAGSLVHAGGGEAWPALAADLRRRLPGLHVAEPALRPIVDPAGAPQPGAGPGVRRELGWPGDAVVVAMCADLIAGQRPEDFVALAHRLRDDGRFRFLLAGDGPLNPGVRDLERLFGLRNLRVERRSRDLGKVLETADVVCTTAELDPFPHAVLAALQRRRPVVAAATGDLPRLLETGPCGIVVPHPGDLDGFEAALRSLADAEARRELGERGPGAVRDFSLSSPLPLGESSPLPLGEWVRVRGSGRRGDHP